MSYKVNPILAKLLAKENISIQHGNYKTAWFDLDNRIIGLPDWKDMGKNVYDLLVGHEVSHALNTPPVGFHHNDTKTKGCPKSYLNVIEDARIEKFIQRDYPGLVRSFSLGYDKLLSDGVFGEIDLDNIDNMKLIDRINLKSKLGSRIDVVFNDEEQVLFNRTIESETWDEVVEIVRDILKLEKQDNIDDQDLGKQTNDQDSDEQTRDQDSDEQTDNQDSDYQIDDQDSDEQTRDQDSDEQTDDQDSDDQDSDEQSDDQDSDEQTDDQDSDYQTDDFCEDEEYSVTDQNFRENESSFIETDTDAKHTLLLPDITEEELNSVVLTYKDLKIARMQSRKDSGITEEKVADYHRVMNDFANIKIKNAKKEIIAATREFELKKSARQYEKSRTSPLGTIDVNKLHSYLIDDDIFSSTTILQDSKNHGMVMLLDLSISMEGCLENVIDQTVFLVMFCKKVNIPFELYTFTTKYGDLSNTTTPKINFKNTNMIKVLSSDMTKSDFNESLMYLCCYNVVSNTSRISAKLPKILSHEIYSIEHISRKLYSSNEIMGGTPLNESLIAMLPLLNQFKKKCNVEKLSFITLCDGDSQHMTTKSCEDLTDAQRKMTLPEKFNRHRVNILYGKEKIKCGARISTYLKYPQAVINDKQLTQKLIESLKRQVGCNVLGFFVAVNNPNFKYRCVGAAGSISDDVWNNKDKFYKSINAEYKKNKCVSIKGAYGYNDYFLIKASGLHNSEEFELEGNESTAQIRNKFKKSSSSKKVYKVLLNKFAASIA